MDYKQSEVPNLLSRMPHGQTSERGKADLMFLQHMLDMVKQRGGSVFTVMPHGVLFRGGEEQKIRAKLLKADLIEAVIGLAPNLFYGTGIPACVIALRPPAQKRPDRRNKVLFINADREFHAERAQNVLLPEHIEKIVSTFRAFQDDETFEDVEGFARAVRREELADNDYNLNIRRYVDNTPPPEPQDVRAHLVGGVPVAEIEAKKELLDAYEIKMSDLFAVRDDDPEYVDFLPESERPDASRLAELASGREQKLWAGFEEWWKAEADQIANLEPVEGDERTEHERKAQLAGLRADLIDSFRERLLAVGLLDRYALAGAVAGWWHDGKNDLKALSVNGFGGVVDGWVENVLTMLAPEPDPRTGGARERTAAERRQAYDHKVVAAIAPDFLEDLASKERTHADLDAKVKAAQEAEAALAEARAAAESPDADEEGPAEIDPALADAVLSKAEMRELTKKRAEAKKAIEELEDDFWPVAAVQRKKAEQREKAKKKVGDGRSGGAAKGRRALAAEEAGQGALLEIPVPVPVEGTDAGGGDGDGPDEGGAVKEARLMRARKKLAKAAGERDVVLGILRDDLAGKLGGHVVRRQRELGEAYRVWEGKYAVSLQDIEGRREKATKALDGFLKELGYVA
ncbi:hypothetical protein GCM10018780_53080 [Streptomyces lanatus]|nr:N-6 DNA methylase [Streptomyces lanatus]GHH13414.1 hypothetical protein GCM10018780_53080 [Streptomyces lanatus]